MTRDSARLLQEAAAGLSACTAPPASHRLALVAYDLAEAIRTGDSAVLLRTSPRIALGDGRSRTLVELVDSHRGEESGRPGVARLLLRSLPWRAGAIAPNARC